MKDTYILTNLLIALLVINTVIKAWLEKRNRDHIRENRSEVPALFAEKVTLEEHQKAADYSIAKIITGKVFRTFGLIIFVGWIFFGGLEVLDTFVRTFEQGPIVTGLIFYGLYILVGMVLELPEGIYTTFFLEERFGFNKTTGKTFVIDMIKGIVLGAVIGLPLLAAILWIMGALGNTWWIWAWAFLTAFQLVITWAYPRFIAPIFNKFTELEEGEVKDTVLALLNRCDFVSKGLFVMDASKRSAHGNAYFTGFGKSKRIVFFDTLLEKLTAGEVEAVLAHELGHFKKKHIVKKMAMLFTMSFVGFAVLGWAYSSEVFYHAHGVSTPSAYMALILFSLIAPVYMFFVTPISAWHSRVHEFEADDYAAEYSNAEELISALVKLHKDNASTLTPDPVYANFYYSHPPAPVRITHLKNSGAN